MFGFLNKVHCEQCQAFNRTRLTHTPQQLSELISDIKTAIKDGTLKPLNNHEQLGGEDFSQVPIHPHWPDIIINHFQCTKCKKQFKLFADTYHGNDDNNGWTVIR